MKRRISNGHLRTYRNAIRDKNVRLLTDIERAIFTNRIGYLLDRRANPVRRGYGRGEIPVYPDDGPAGVWLKDYDRQRT